jgi:hypothetical protein
LFESGRDKRGPRPAPPEQELAVDAALEGDCSEVERAVDAYIGDQRDDRRQALLKALETLDSETDDSDAYASRTSWRSILGAPAPDVIGETGPYPVAEDISSTEFDGQVALVKAAKQVVLQPNPHTLAALEAARSALRRFRDQAGSASD